MKPLSLIIAFVCCLNVVAQPKIHNLSRMNENDRNAYLVEKAKEVVLNFGPDYYREYGEPEISELKTFTEDRWEKYKGDKYYTVTFRYDKTKETLEWDFAAEVDIWEKDGEPQGVKFGNGIGLHFLKKSYRQKVKEGIKNNEKAVYRTAGWMHGETCITNKSNK